MDGKPKRRLPELVQSGLTAATRDTHQQQQEQQQQQQQVSTSSPQHPGGTGASTAAGRSLSSEQQAPDSSGWPAGGAVRKRRLPQLPLAAAGTQAMPLQLPSHLLPLSQQLGLQPHAPQGGKAVPTTAVTARAALLAAPVLPAWDRRYRLCGSLSSQSPGAGGGAAVTSALGAAGAGAHQDPATNPALLSPVSGHEGFGSRSYSVSPFQPPAGRVRSITGAAAAAAGPAGDVAAHYVDDQPEQQQLLPRSAAEDLWDWEPPQQGKPAGRRRGASGSNAPASGDEGSSGEGDKEGVGPHGATTTPQRRTAGGALRQVPAGASTRGAGGSRSRSRRAPLPCAPTEHAASAGVVQPDAAAAAEEAGAGLLSTGGVGPGGEPPLVITPAGTPGPVLQVPGSITAVLRPYQAEGVTWLGRQYAHSLGGVLADDMGLGKTLQAIALVAALLGKTGDQRDLLPAGRRYAGSAALPGGPRWPLLVVAPSSVLENWQREFQRWGSFRVAQYTAASAQSVVDAAAGGALEVVVASYDMLRRHGPHLAAAGFHAAIFDEVHRLKNARSSTYQAAAALPTHLRYGLTGTPMQNAYDELWCLMDFICPTCLGPAKEFKAGYAVPIKAGQRLGASSWEVTQGAERNRRLVGLLRRLMLRRDKRLIADQLPRKSDAIVFCRLAPAQVAAYRALLALPDIAFLAACASPCACGSGERGLDCCLGDPVTRLQDMGDSALLWSYYHCCDCDDPECLWHKPDGCEKKPKCPWCLVLPTLMLLQKVANHLELLRPDPADAAKNPRKFEFDSALWRQVGGEALAGGWVARSTPQHCGKLAALVELLGRWAAGGQDKVLLFSHSTRALDLLQEVAERQGYECLRLDGSTPPAERQGLVDAFNGRPSCFLFLISTGAGGVGLNLTGANKVVVFDPSWNPAADAQAQDRAFRLGQVRDVGVYRLVAAGSLEEVVYGRQVYKQQAAALTLTGEPEKRQFEGVQGDRGRLGELWGIANLLRADPGLEAPQQQPQQPWQRAQQRGGPGSSVTALPQQGQAPAGDAEGSVQGGSSMLVDGEQCSAAAAVPPAPGLIRIEPMADLGLDELPAIDVLLDQAAGTQEEAAQQRVTELGGSDVGEDSGGEGGLTTPEAPRVQADQGATCDPQHPHQQQQHQTATDAGEGSEGAALQQQVGEGGPGPARSPLLPQVDPTLDDLMAAGGVHHLHRHELYLGPPSQPSTPAAAAGPELDQGLADLGAFAKMLAGPRGRKRQPTATAAAAARRPAWAARKGDAGRVAEGADAPMLMQLQEAISTAQLQPQQNEEQQDAALLELPLARLGEVLLEPGEVAEHAPALAALAEFWGRPLAEVAQVVLGLTREQVLSAQVDYATWREQQ